MKHPTDEEIDQFAHKLIDNYGLIIDHQDPFYAGITEGAKWARDQQPKLKTLEWEERESSLLCEIIGCDYEIWGNIGGYFLRINPGCYTLKGKSIADCKQLAQADYERRINELYI